MTHEAPTPTPDPARPTRLRAALRAVERLSSRKGSFLFEVTRLLSSSLLHVFLMVIFGILTFRIWGREGRGLITTAIAFTNLANLVGDLGITRALPQMIGRKVAPVDHLLSSALSLYVVTILVMIPLGIGYFMLPITEDVGAIWIVLALAFIPLQLFDSYLKGFALGVERVDVLSKVVWMRDPALVVITIGFGLVYGFRGAEPGAPNANLGWQHILALNLVHVIPVVYGLRFMASYGRLRLSWDRNLVVQTAVRIFTFGLGPLCMRLIQRGNVALLTLAIFSIPREEIGDYTLGSATVMLLWVLSAAICNVLMSRSANEDDPEAQSNRTARLVRLGLIVAVPGAIALAVAAPVLIPIVYGRGTEPAGKILQLLLPGVLAFFITQALATDLLARDRPRLVAMVTAPAFVFSIIFNAVYAIPNHGVMGAAATVSACYLLTTMMIVPIYCRTTGVPINRVIVPRLEDLRSLPYERVLRRLRRR